MNENLARWIFLSAAKHLKVVADANNIPYFVEGAYERDETMEESHAEMRSTGPFVKEISNDYYQVRVVLNMMLTTYMQMQGTTAWQIQQWAGIFQSAMLDPIPIYKYGVGIADTGALIGCLRVKTDREDMVRVFHFGQIDRTDRVRQSEVDAEYEFYLVGAEVGTGTAHYESVASAMNLTDSGTVGAILNESVSSTLNMSSVVSSVTSIPFITTWATANPGTTNSQQIQLPLEATGSYNFNVDWGDGNDDDITVWNDAATLHTYNASGNYTVTISGSIEGWRFNAGGDRRKLTNISSWGPLQPGSTGNQFDGCENMTCNAADVFDTSNTTNMGGMFRNCAMFDGDLSGIDTANATSMAALFADCAVFNQNIGSWNTHNVTNMASAFIDCATFNQNIGSWNTHNATSMVAMFKGCTAFNQNISSWNTHNVTTMGTMFREATAFDQPIGSWNTANLGTTSLMFYNSGIDQDFGSWDVTSMTAALLMFFGVTLSTANYDSLLTGWEAQAVQSGVSFHAGSSQYSAGAPATARANLVSAPESWSITDGGAA